MTFIIQLNEAPSNKISSDNDQIQNFWLRSKIDWIYTYIISYRQNLILSIS